MRACGVCGRAVKAGRRCDRCARSNPSPNYDADHRRRRAILAPVVATGKVRCARGAACKYAELVDGQKRGGLIRRGQRWELDHRDDGRGYLGASHADCNQRAGALRREGGGR